MLGHVLMSEIEIINDGGHEGRNFRGTAGVASPCPSPHARRGESPHQGASSQFGQRQPGYP